MLKSVIRRIVLDRDTKEEVVIGLEVGRRDILCLYKDRNGVFISLSNGRVVKADHTLRELQRIFGI